MNTYNLILKTIEDELIKCNDGSSLPKVILEQYKEFIKSKINEKYEHLSTFNANGDVIITSVGDEYSVNMRNKELFWKSELEGLHTIHTHPTNIKLYENALKRDEDDNPIHLTDLMEILNIPTNFSRADLMTGWEDSTVLNDNFLYQSVSCCDFKGNIMTISKTNKFTKKDMEEYEKVANSFESRCHKYRKNYEETFKRLFNEEAKNYAKQGKIITDDEKFKLAQKVNDKTIKEIGTFKKFLKEEGLEDDFRKCNAKLTLRKVKL